MTKIDDTIEYATAHRTQFLADFEALLRIPSISTDPAYRADVQQAADWLVAEMARIGLQNGRSIAGDGQPVVYGDWLNAGANKPTVLIYAHYDVQPVDPLDLWQSPPFEPTLREGKLYARGAIDDKSGVMVTLKALESILAATGTLPVNVKLFFEGEEETGSPSMAPFIRRHKDLLRADLLVISDAGSPPEQPQMFTSLRGMVSAEVLVRGPKRDLHSGSFGGIVHNPAHHVAKLIAALHDANGRIQIPGFYDDVRPLTAAQQEQLAALEADTRERKQRESGVPAFWGPADRTIGERLTALPTCDVNGLTSGYQAQGGKTIIPAQASFKCSMRLVAGQDPEDIAAKFTDFVHSFDTETVDVEVLIHGKCRAAELLFAGPAIDAAQRAFTATWGQPARLYRQGGSVPVVGIFREVLPDLPVMNLGYQTGDNGHAPNEYYILDYFYRGIETAVHFLHYLGEMK